MRATWLNRVTIVGGCVALTALVYAASMADDGWWTPRQTASYDNYVTYDGGDTPYAWATNTANTSAGCNVKVAYTVREMTGGSASGNRYPLGLTFTIVGQSNVSGTFEASIKQTKQYVNGNLIDAPASPRNIDSVGIPYSTTQTVTWLPLQRMTAGLIGKDSTWTAGEYICQLLPKAGGNCGPTLIMKFFINSQNNTGFDDPIGSGGGDGEPGVGANGDLEEQTGFWGGLFQDLLIPTEASTDALTDATDQFRNWGPFGVCAQIGEELTNDTTLETATLGVADCPYCVPLGSTEWTGPIVVDFTPWQAWIKFFRVLILMGLIWAFGWSLIRWGGAAKTGA